MTARTARERAARSATQDGFLSMRDNYLFTSESVSEGHPDKVSDQISDAIVDLMLAKDPESRIACETMTTTQRVVLAGEIRCKPIYDTARWPETHGWAPGARDEIEATVRKVVRDIGYEQDGFHWESLSFENHLHGQSDHIAQGVDASGNKDEGAGDQGIMFGFACDETEELMPAALHYSHRILKRLADDRKSGAAPFLEPDAKSQVTLRYANERPVEATAIVVSTQHAPGYYFHNGEGDEAKYAELRDYVKGVVAELLPAELLTANTVYHINPTGRFEIGGPDGDAGVTGRKIIVDTYGGASPHGGGAFSGKDPTKVDRSAAYVTRYLAKNIVAAGLARRCTIQLSYAIGVAEPLSIYVDLHGTGNVDEGKLEAVIPQLVRLTPKGIRTHLGLNKPIYRQTAAYGHFGRTATGDAFPWERTDLVDKLKAALAD
jgi:S-adenosylmethionine synthetase